MGALKRTDSGILVDSTVDVAVSADKLTHWASWANGDGGELFNGSQAQCVGVMAGFLHRHGMSAGFECGMGKLETAQ